jgi:alkaline phosphatase
MTTSTYKIHSLLTLYILISVALFSTVTAMAAEQSSKNLDDFSYPDIPQEVSDISFYQPENIHLVQQPRSKKVTNVILLVGDGMGISQITMARIKSLGGHGMLNMEKMPYAGFVHTSSSKELITDSAASGTAFACGVKTNNGMIGMTPDQTPYQSILKVTQNKGMRTGMVVTSTITHATPAVFASHHKNRNAESDIAKQILSARVNVLFGGGKQYWLPKSNPLSKRTDEINLIEMAQQFGYQCIGTQAQLNTVKGEYVLGLFQTEALTTFSPEPSLPEMVDKAIELLHTGGKASGNTPFFLMIEGSQIDWAGHANNTDNTIKQTLLFDITVGHVLRFAQADGNTLVIVTADHETGGLAITKGDIKGEKLTASWASKSHTPVAVPIYSYGPGAHHFTGTLDNTQIPIRISRLLGIKTFPIKDE